MSKKIIYNAIPTQEKTERSKIEPKEWNFIINSLRKQTNINAEILEKLLLTTELTDQMVDKIIKEFMERTNAAIEDVVVNIINDYKEISISKKEPEGNEILWIQIKGE